MSMSKKDHVLIAATLTTMKRQPIEKDDDIVWNTAVQGVIYAMANALARDNPQFNKQTFLFACGIDV